MPSYLTDAATTILGILAGMMAQSFRQHLMRPKLKLSFNADANCLRDTPASLDGIPTKARSVRFRVENWGKTNAHCAQAFLTNVERKSPDGSYQSLFDDRLRLKWSYNSAQPTDIPSCTGLYCDLVMLDDKQCQLIPQTCEPQPLLWRTLVKPGGVYRSTVFVAADHANPMTISITLNWKDKHDIESANVG